PLHADDPHAPREGDGIDPALRRTRAPAARLERKRRSEVDIPGSAVLTSGPSDDAAWPANRIRTAIRQGADRPRGDLALAAGPLRDIWPNGQEPTANRLPRKEPPCPNVSFHR